MKLSITLSIIFMSMLLLTGCGCSNSANNKAQTIPSTTEVATTEPTTEALTAEVILSDDVLLPNDNSDDNENSENDYTTPSFEESEDVIIINDDMVTVQ